MIDNTLKLYQSSGSPNSRRVRIFLAEKGLEIPLIAVDLGKGEQHTEAYRAINPRRVVPTSHDTHIVRRPAARDGGLF
jgi:glutathione S-transferase